MTSTRSRHSEWARKATKARVEGSAQWRSSRTSTTGHSAPMRSRRASNASKRRLWEAPASPSSGPAPASPGRRRASSARALGSRASSAGCPSRASGRSADTSAAYGSSPSPSSTASPLSTSAPAVSARWRSSLTRRVFPTPESPATKAREGRPVEASASASSSCCISSVRPISRLLVTRVDTGPVSRGRGCLPGEFVGVGRDEGGEEVVDHGAFPSVLMVDTGWTPYFADRDPLGGRAQTGQARDAGEAGGAGALGSQGGDPGAEHRDDVLGAGERVGDDPAVPQRDGGDGLAVDDREHRGALHRARGVQLGEVAQDLVVVGGGRAEGDDTGIEHG